MVLRLSVVNTFTTYVGGVHQVMNQTEYAEASSPVGEAIPTNIYAVTSTHILSAACYDTARASPSPLLMRQHLQFGDNY